MAARKPGRSRVTRAGTAKTARDPGPKATSEAAQRNAAVKPTPGAAVAAKKGSQVPMRPGDGVTDRSSAATGSSIFGKADAGNRRLGRRNRTGS